MRLNIDNLRYISGILTFMVALAVVAPVQALDLLSPFKKLFGKDGDDIVYWSSPGQYVKIVEQDWDRDHRKAPRNDHPARLDSQQLAIVLSSLQGWRPEDSPERNRSVPLFTSQEVSSLASRLAEALNRAGPEQDVVFAVVDFHQGFSGDSRRSTAARVFVENNRLNMIFGDVLRSALASDDSDDISHYEKPHRAGKRMESYGRDIIVNVAHGISHHRVIERPRLDWVTIDVPTVVAAYSGPQLTTAPVVTAAMNNQAGSSLSAENRKLREELARMRKQTVESGEAPAAFDSSPQQPAYNTALPEPVSRPVINNPVPAATARTMNPGTSTSGNVSVIQQKLAVLKDLYDKGLIKEDEYDAKRKEILKDF